VLGFELTGELQEGATATDLVLTVTEMLRRKGVVGKFVEFHGPGLANLPLADRATIGNMSPEFGSTCAIFPIDAETLRYLEFSGRPKELIALVEAYAKEQGLWHDESSETPTFSEELELDLSTVVPSVAGPRRPQDRVSLTESKNAFRSAVEDIVPDDDEEDDAIAETFPASDPVSTHVRNGDGNEPRGGRGGTEVIDRKEERVPVTLADGTETELDHGHVVIAAITSCTNTSNPSVMIGSGLLARKAVAKGLTSKPWVKTSLAPGSRVVTDYFEKAGVLGDLAALGFDVVGYGCTTCIGNSGPLKPEISAAVKAGDITACSVLSGNRNFEGRVHPEVKMNFLASPPLVVAYAIAGTLDIDLTKEPISTGKDGKPVMLADIWPSDQEVQEALTKSIDSAMFQRSYASVFTGDANWTSIKVPEGKRYTWDAKSTYVKNPPYFDGMTMTPGTLSDIKGARALAVLGDSVTTDHISPAGNISKSSPAAKYLVEQGVQPVDFNSYGARRGNHEVMMRGTFANIRLRNLLVPGVEGGVSVHLPTNEQMSIYDAAMKYKKEGTPLVILAGREYGTGSSRDWAAKGTMLLGVKAVISESFERIHRSNLIGMGVVPLQFLTGQNAQSLGLTGREVFDISGLTVGDAKEVSVVATPPDGGKPISFKARVRIDTPKEREYYRHGGILQYVLRQLAAPGKAA
jgi:aconitate hydratase